MTSRKTLMRAEERAALPDGGRRRYELAKGELRESELSNEAHGEIAERIAHLLISRARQTRAGRGGARLATCWSAGRIPCAHPMWPSSAAPAAPPTRCLASATPCRTSEDEPRESAEKMAE